MDPQVYYPGFGRPTTITPGAVSFARNTDEYRAETGGNGATKTGAIVIATPAEKTQGQSDSIRLETFLATSQGSQTQHRVQTYTIPLKAAPAALQEHARGNGWFDENYPAFSHLGTYQAELAALRKQQHTNAAGPRG